MHILTKFSLISSLVTWRISLGRRDLDRNYARLDDPRFKSAMDAARMIRDGSVVAFSGLAGNARPVALHLAIRKLFEQTGHPKDLTLISAGGQGGRGKLPSTLEELGVENLCRRFISGHLETYKSFLRLADAGKLEIQCIPIGVISQLFHMLAHGESCIVTDTGKGTFVDPECGRGTPVCLGKPAQLVSSENGRLRFEMPKIDVAIFNAPAADKKGNIYYKKNAVMISDTRDITYAAKENGGIVIANVGRIVEEGYDRDFLPADLIDAVVLDPRAEQTMVSTHRKPWLFMTTESDLPVGEGIARIRFVNNLLGITPRRTEINRVIARLAATQVVKHVHEGCLVNIGAGLPEEVCNLLCDFRILDDITLCTEAGIVGGIPTPGIYFGAAVCPEEMIDASELFRRSQNRLDLAVFGALQVDSSGNVNVSKRGEGVINYVGPGGFLDLSNCAKTVIFMTTWMAHAEIVVTERGIQIKRRGKSKFVDRVDEICFNGDVALKKGQRAIYVTELGAFELTKRGMELRCVMPGIDIQKDILDSTPMKVILSADGNVPVIPMPVITGTGFTLELNESAMAIEPYAAVSKVCQPDMSVKSG